MEIDWLTYGVDVDSAAFWDKYYTAAKHTSENEKEMEESDNEAERIRAYCATFRRFYEDLIGKENADKLLEQVQDNRRSMDSVYESLLRYIYQQKMDSRNRMVSILLKYAPKKQEEHHDTSAV